MALNVRFSLQRYFLKSPNFDGWFRTRRREMIHKLEALHLEALCEEVRRCRLPPWGWFPWGGGAPVGGGARAVLEAVCFRGLAALCACRTCSKESSSTLRWRRWIWS